MGIPEDESQLPDNYLCEQCSPQDHKQLLAAIARGEKPWEERALQRKREEEEERKAKKRGKGGKKGKGLRHSRSGVVKSDASEIISSTPVKEPQVPVALDEPEISNKRKQSPDVEVDGGSQVGI